MRLLEKNNDPAEPEAEIPVDSLEVREISDEDIVKGPVGSSLEDVNRREGSDDDIVNEVPEGGGTKKLSDSNIVGNGSFELRIPDPRVVGSHESCEVDVGGPAELTGMKL